VIPRTFFHVILLLAVFFSASLSHAIDEPLRKVSGLNKPVKETMKRVATARVIVADYELIKKDFPSLKNKSNEEINQWLLDRTAYVSTPQAAQEAVNTKIHVGEETVEAYRPKDYGRSIVFDLGEEGLIDAKGTGALKALSIFDHSNGLASLGESLREYLYEKLVAKIFKHSGSPFQTVGTYAVIDYGFDVKGQNDSLARAGSVLRQAHDRATGAFSLIDNKTALKVEKLLRTYGVTSAGAHRNTMPYEWLNLQGTKGNAVVDFGGFLTVEKYEKALVQALTYPRVPLKNPLMNVAQVAKLQPNPEFRIPLDIWGTTRTGKIDPAFDNPWIYSHELADALKNGTATPEDAIRHIENMLGPIDELFRNHPALPYLVEKCGPGILSSLFQ
jgi:hypothetical protein